MAKLRQVRLLLVCPEFLDSPEQLGSTMGFEYDSLITVPGGGYSLGYLNLFTSRIGERRYSLPRKIYDSIFDGIHRAIDDVAAGREVNIRRADFVTDFPCETWIQELRTLKAPQMGVHAQAELSMREVLIQVQAERRKSGRSPIKRQKLQVENHHIDL